MFEVWSEICVIFLSGDLVHVVCDGLAVEGDVPRLTNIIWICRCRTPRLFEEEDQTVSFQAHGTWRRIEIGDDSPRIVDHQFPATPFRQRLRTHMRYQATVSHPTQQRPTNRSHPQNLVHHNQQPKERIPSSMQFPPAYHHYIPQARHGHGTALRAPPARTSTRSPARSAHARAALSFASRAANTATRTARRGPREHVSWIPSLRHRLLRLRLRLPRSPSTGLERRRNRRKREGEQGLRCL